MTQSLNQHIQHYFASSLQHEKILWLVDENIDVDFFDNSHHRYSHIKVMTNRYDQFIKLQQRGWDITFSDFDFSTQATYFDKIVYRVAKEKDQVHHLINEAGKLLNTSGELVLIGQKQEGTKTYYKKAQSYLLGSSDLSKQGNIYIATLHRADALGEELIHNHYPTMRSTIAWQDHHLQSKPGVFGWDKIDHGSALLIETLKTQLPSITHTHSDSALHVLDLGCGYGLISIAANTLLSEQLKLNHVNITGTDNNAAAVAACQQNFIDHNLSGQVIAADCGHALASESFDLILCNPPFHQGFSSNNQLTEHFLQQSKRLLKPKHYAIFVVNQFIPLEKKALSYFKSSKVLADDKKFKVIQLEG